MSQRPTLSLTLAGLALIATPALAQPRVAKREAAVVLKDGGTIRGLVTIHKDTVTIELVGEDGKSSYEVRLAAESVVRIESPNAKRASLPRATVTLKDGRRLRGRVRVGEIEVEIEGQHGKLVVAKDEVDRIESRLAPAPRTALDGDLGLAVALPKDWEPDSPSGLGERLRLAHDSGRAYVQVLVREATSGSGVERVRAALANDLSSSGRVTALPGGRRFRVTDRRPAFASGPGVTLQEVGQAELRGEVVVWTRGIADASLEKEVHTELAELVKSPTWLPAGRTLEGSVYRKPRLRLLVEAPTGFRVDPPRKGKPVRLASPEHPKARLYVYETDEAEPRAALLARLKAAPDSTADTRLAGLRVVRTKAAKERGVAFRVNKRTVVVIARAPDAEQLSALTSAVSITDPLAVPDEANTASELQVRIKKARGMTNAVAALRELKPVLDVYPNDPWALGAKVTAIRAQERERPEQLLLALDDAWVSSGAEWIAKELGDTLLARGRALRPTDYQRASDAFVRAAEVNGVDATLKEVMQFFLEEAQAAYKKQELTQAWARFALARKVAGPWPELDTAELKLRLESADAALRAKKPDLARRQARRAYQLGAEAKKVDLVYARAENLQERLARERSKVVRRRGGFSFGFPPTRSGARSSFVRETVFTRPGRGSRRVRRTTQSNRSSRRVRPVRRSSGRTNRFRSRGRRGRSNRVVTNGGSAF